MLVMVFRPLSQHPAFVPLAGAVAALVALIVLPLVLGAGTTPGAASPAAIATGSRVVSQPAPATSDAPVLLSGVEIARIDLIRDGATADSVRVQVDGRFVQLGILDDTRIIVPLNGHPLVSASTDLARGQHADIELAPGEQLGNGAHIARLTVLGTGDNLDTSA
jgi:hypothetical protein